MMKGASSRSLRTVTVSRRAMGRAMNAVMVEMKNMAWALCSAKKAPTRA